MGLERHSSIRAARRLGRRLAVAGACLGALLLPALGAALAQGGDDFEQAPILYTKTQPEDPVARFQKQIDSGEVTLKADPRRGYLPAVLRQLGIPASSQTLVFSKTSFQRQLISPRTPRALYFNDESYVGWVQGGDLLEISTVDPQLGAVFYVLSQAPQAKPKFVRQTYECLSCHSSTLTRGVPGHTVRSVYAGRDGLPVLSAGTHITTDESPFRERWGGWYVTGTHGRQRHMGNITVKDAEDAAQPNLNAGANVTDLRSFFNTAPYLTPHSDIAALMVMEHQTNLHNLITKAGYETRRALHFEQTLNRQLGRPAGHRSDSTTSRIRSVGEPLVRALLFSGEAKLAEPVRGTSTFTRDFALKGPRDRRRRSLRELDLKTRLFRYPCSYLIYSPAFDRLPDAAKEYVYGRLAAVLGGQENGKEFAHLSGADRGAVLQILLETKPEFAAWQAKNAPTPKS